MTIQEEIKQLFEILREDYLYENCSTEKDSVPYGETEVELECGYSDKNWEEATLFAKEELTKAFNHIINNN